MNTLKKINKIKEAWNWYTLDGQEGVILDKDDFNSIFNPSDFKGNDNSIFIPFYSLSHDQLNILIEEVEANYTPCGTYDEAYGFESEKGEEIELTGRVNQENEQKIIYDVFSLKSCADAEGFQMQYLTFTNGYYDWTSELTRDYERQEAAERDAQEKRGYVDLSQWEYSPSEEFLKEKQEAYNKLSPEAQEILNYI